MSITVANLLVTTPEQIDSPFSPYEIEIPKLDEAALYGLAGAIVRKIEPHTETHPAALLTQLLVGAGNLIGRSPFFRTESDRQRLNLFTVIVGKTSRGRKGTSWGNVRSFLAECDTAWESTRIMGGLASGEGVIAELKDEEEVIKDKRLLLMETEFSQVLRVGQRDGNTLSTLLRNAWDTGNLRNMSKSAPLRASDCHISLIGHITKTELTKLLTENDSANGFANRICWCYSAHTRLLPDGGDIGSLDLREEKAEFKRVVQYARQRGEMNRTAGARDYWREIYPELTKDIEGRWGQVTSRAEAQVVRLSMLYCLLDGAREIGLEHLKAAESLWSYYSQSARWAFSEHRFGPDARKLLVALEFENLTMKQVANDVFRKNLSTVDIDRVMAEVKDLISITPHPTGGRTAHIVSLRRTNGPNGQSTP
jgi:Protein of unknown function (DUF3987)